MKPVLTNLSQSMESMASIQSTPSVQLGESGCFRRVSANPNPSSTTIPEDGLPPHDVSAETRVNIIQRIDFGTADSNSAGEAPGSGCVSASNARESGNSADLCESRTGCEENVLDSRTIGCTEANSKTLTVNSEVADNCEFSQITSSQSLVAESVDQDSAAVIGKQSTEICDTSPNTDQSALSPPIDESGDNMISDQVCSSSSERITSSVSYSDPNNPESGSVQVKLRAQALPSRSKVPGAALVDISKRWSSSFIETNAANVLPPKECAFESKKVNKADSGTGSLESRRSLSECSLNAMSELAAAQRRGRPLRKGPHSSSVGNKLDDEASVVSAGSDGSKGVNE